MVFNYTKGIWDENDVKNLISKSVIGSKNDDLHFFNLLLKYGAVEIFDEYLPRAINKNKLLKYLLDKCGYRTTKQNDPLYAGHRGYIVDRNVKEYYGYIK